MDHPPTLLRLPLDVVEAAEAFPPGLAGRRFLFRRKVDPALADALLAKLDRLPPASVMQAEAELPWLLGLHRHSPYELHNESAVTHARAGDIRMMRRTPGLAYLYLFHRDGFVRETALGLIDGPVRSAFFASAIALRLNDWVDAVRATAARCTDRAFAGTEPGLLADAALFLLDRQSRWRRWVHDAPVLQDALLRPDVVECVAERMIAATTGPTAALLRAALRTPHFDHLLPRIATNAFMPGVRVAAYRALMRGTAQWPSHREKKWVDKSMGIYRHDWVYAHRPIERADSADHWLAQAAADRSAAVRRVAVIALLTPGSEFANAEHVARLLAADRNPVLRQRGQYALNMRTGAAID